MKEFIEYILAAIVDDKESVKVSENRDGEYINVSMIVSPNDMGTVIGKGGRNIRNIRALAKVKALKENCRVNVSLEDPYGDENRHNNSFSPTF